MTTVFSIVLTLCYAAHEKNLESCADGIFRLAGNSVLSEYDHYIQRDYGLFLISGTDAQLSSKFRNYSSYSLTSLKGTDLKEAMASGRRFSTADQTLIYDQIIEYMNVAKAKTIISKGGTETSSEENPMELRTLRHGPTIDSLPSAALPDKNIIASAEQFSEKLNSFDQIYQSGSDSFLLDSYILSTFNTDTLPRDTAHFFRNEVEYIISGTKSDETNLKRTDLALEALRLTPNLAHIYADTEKLAIITAASETITPGPLGTVTQAGIALAWASAESLNDVRLLHMGYKVPLTKTTSSWATDLEGVIQGLGGSTIHPKENTGYTYNDYLRALLFIKDSNIKTSRIMDLIQINMRNSYKKDFVMHEFCAGIEYKAKLNNREYYYDQIY